MDISEQTVIINPHAMLPVGTLLLNGKYRIERHLSSGGFGNTYVATNTEFEEQVAIKEFFIRGVTERDGDSVSVNVSNQDNIEQFTSQREKFKKEARRLRRLKNEHIVGVHDLFEENGTAYYEMDLIKGESLAERMKRTDQPLSEEDVLKILDQVLDALSVVHAQGLYHLDLKPANIMVDQTGRALLIDFGASKQMSAGDGLSVSTSSALAFTPGYAPLEQTEQNTKSFGPWTDLYALGATIYKLLTGQNPPSSSEIISMGGRLQFSSVVSPRMQQLITWMMKPAYLERPQSVDDVKQFLSSKQSQSQPQPTSVYTPKQPTEQSFGGNKLWWAVGAGIAAATVAVAIVVTILLPKAPSKVTAITDTIEQVADSVETITVNGVSFKMVRVEGGSFQMGATLEQGSDAYDDEKLVHQVTLSTFSIGETEVTQELWQAVMGTNPSTFKGPKRPVEQVSWEDCQNFIRELNSLTGRSFRLPTEAEWEYAARGGNRSNGSKYAGSNAIHDVAWYTDNSGSTTHEIATKRANELGLYDMSGNVLEWCQDWYGSYSSGSQTNPAGVASDSDRVYRGGCWLHPARQCRVSYRSGTTPSDRYYSLGFRLAF